MEFTGIGRSVRGAAGNVRSTNRVELEEAENGSTRVLLESDMALGGMLGSVGQKVVAKQASLVTKSFAQALAQELSGGAPDSRDQALSPGATGQAGEQPAPPQPAPATEVSVSRRPSAAQIAIAGIVLFAILLILRWARSR
jgi:hypothetical protein